MAILAPPPVVPVPASDAPELRRLWTLDEYYRMAELGLFGDDERVELLDGELFVMPPQMTPHATSVRKTGDALRVLFGEGFVVSVQLPVTLGLRSEPEPDVCVAHGETDDYADHHPGPGEIVLLVEVSDSTLQKDRTRKAAAYARAAVPEYWIVNVLARQVETFRGPAPDGTYAELRTLTAGAEILPIAAPPGTPPVRVGDLFIFIPAAPFPAESEPVS